MRIVSAWWDGEKINCVNNSKHNPCNESSWKIKYHSSWVHILPFNSKCSALECKIRKLLHVYSYYPPHSIYSAIKPFNIHAYFPGLVRRICRREFPDHGLLQTFVRTIFFAGLGRGVSGKGREVDVIILTCLPRFLKKMWFTKLFHDVSDVISALCVRSSMVMGFHYMTCDLGGFSAQSRKKNIAK